MFFYLYEIRNNLNGKIYVGVHKTKSLDDGYMGSGKVIRSAIKKYGVENFTKVILEHFDTSEAMYAREKEVVTGEFLLREDTYNLRRGGTGGFDYINKAGLAVQNLCRPEVHTRTVESAISRRQSVGRTDAEVDGNKRSSQTLKEKFKREGHHWAGRSHRQETIALMKQSHKGKHVKEKNSQFGTCWVSHELVGSRKCKITNLPNMIDQGWVKGRNVFKSEA